MASVRLRPIGVRVCGADPRHSVRVYGPIVGGAVHVLSGFEEEEDVAMAHTVRVLQGGAAVQPEFS